MFFIFSKELVTIQKCLFLEISYVSSVSQSLSNSDDLVAMVFIDIEIVGLFLIVGEVFKPPRVVVCKIGIVFERVSLVSLVVIVQVNDHSCELIQKSPVYHRLFWIELTHKLIEHIFLLLHQHVFLDSCKSTIYRLLRFALIDRFPLLLALYLVLINDEFAAKTDSAPLMHFHIDLDEEL